METSSVGETVIEEKSPEGTYTHIWGIKKDGSELADIRRMVSEARDSNEMLFISEWTPETQKKFLDARPNIVFPVELPPSADEFDAYYSLPVDPYLITDEEHQGAIVAGGYDSYDILFNDDKTIIEDDIIRYRLIATSPHDIYDPEGIYVKNGIHKYFRGRHERTAAQLTNVITILGKVAPLPFLGPATIPLFAFRLAVNARNIAYDEIHRISHLLPGMDDPEKYADLVRSLKPFFEKTDDHEIQDALVALKMQEALEKLKQSGIGGNVASFSPHEHSAGEYQWASVDTQLATLDEEIRAIVAIRKNLAVAQNQRVTTDDWQKLADEIREQYAPVTIFGVENTPGSSSADALKHRIPILHRYHSEPVTEQIYRSMSDDQDISLERTST